MAMLHQGDAFALPFTVSSGGTELTPNNCAGLSAALGTYTVEYGEGGIQWDSINEQWLFPITAEMSASFGAGDTPFQARAEFSDGSVLHTDVVSVQVKGSIIRRRTSGG